MILINIARVITSFLWEEELVFLFLAGFLVHQTKFWAIGLLFAVILSYALTELFRIYCAKQNVMAAIEWFDGLQENVRLTEVEDGDFKRLIDPKLYKEIELTRTSYLKNKQNRVRIGLKTEYKPLRVFTMSLTDGSDIPLALKSYPSFYNTSYIFVHSLPKEDDALGRFRFFHELAHLTYHGASQQCWRYGGCIKALATAVIFILVVGPHWLIIPLLLWMVVRVFSKWDAEPQRGEVFADTFALRQLNDLQQAEEVVRIHENVWRSIANRWTVANWRDTTGIKDDSTFIKTRLESNEKFLRLMGMKRWISAAKKCSGVLPAPIYFNLHVDTLIGCAIMCYGAYLTPILNPMLLTLLIALALAPFLKPGMFLPYEWLYSAERRLEDAIERRQASLVSQI